MKLLFLFSAISFLLFINKAEAQEFNYKVNAVYVYYFTKYISWPDNSITGNITIGVLGDSNIINELESVTANKKVNGHSIIILKIDAAEVNKCQIVIVSKSQSRVVKQLDEATKNLPVLIVSEKQGLTSRGAGICIYVDDEDNFKTKIELSKENIQSRGLKVSNELSALSELVN